MSKKAIYAHSQQLIALHERFETLEGRLEALQANYLKRLTALEALGQPVLKTKHVGWINIYPTHYVGYIYQTRAEADAANENDDNDCIACVEISWEE